MIRRTAPARSFTGCRENRADNSSQKAAAQACRGGLPRFCAGQIFADLVRKPGDGQGLQPDLPRTGQHGQEQAITAEDHVLDAWNHRDLEGHGGLKSAHVSRMHTQRLAGRQVLDDQLPAQFKPSRSLAGKLLQEESVAAEDARAQRLLKADADGDLRSGAKEAMAVHHVLLPRDELDGHNVPRHLGGEGNLAGILHGAVFGHEDASAAGNPL